MRSQVHPKGGMEWRGLPPTASSALARIYGRNQDASHALDRHT